MMVMGIGISYGCDGYRDNYHGESKQAAEIQNKYKTSTKISSALKNQ